MKFLYVLCVLCGLNLPAIALDREAFTFTNYNLNVRIEPEQQRLAARGTITLRNDSCRCASSTYRQETSMSNITPDSIRLVIGSSEAP